MEVSDLLRWFSKVVEISMEGLKERSKHWVAMAVVARSLGRWVAPNLVAQDFQLRAGIKGLVVVYGLKRGFLLFQFGDVEE